MTNRIRIGVMVPSTNTTCEADFQLVSSKNVSIHGSRLWLTNDSGGDTDFDRMNSEIESAARYLATANVDAISYGCTTGSFYKGPGWDEEMMKIIEKAAGVPAAATSPSVVQALRFFGAKRISVATPYPDYNNQKLLAYLEAMGFEVLNLEGEPVAAASGNQGINNQDPESVMEFAAKICRDDADALLTQGVDDVVKHGLFMVGKRCRRLIEDHHFGGKHQRPCDFDHLLLGDRKIAYHVLRAERALQPIENFSTLPVQSLPIDQVAPLLGQASQEDVFGHRHFRHQRLLLVNQDDAALLGALGVIENLLFALEQDLTAIGFVLAGQHFHQRGFTGTVLAEQGMNLTCPNIEADLVERDHPREFLGDVHQREDWRFCFPRRI